MATHRPTPPSHFQPRTTICVQSHAGNLDQARRKIDHVYRLPSTNRRRNGTSQPGTGTVSPRLLQLPNRRLGRLPPIHGIRTQCSLSQRHWEITFPRLVRFPTDVYAPCQLCHRHPNGGRTTTYPGPDTQRSNRLPKSSCRNHETVRTQRTNPSL